MVLQIRKTRGVSQRIQRRGSQGTTTALTDNGNFTPASFAVKAAPGQATFRTFTLFAIVRFVSYQASSDCFH
jgi:hypothetical protein